jgi:non-specific serine/threonine protein kinase
VFVGGWTLEAAEAVCADGLLSRDVLDLTSRLVDKSLVLMEERAGESRYRMLETLRQYSAERLGEAGEAETCRHRHAMYYAELAEKAEIGLRGSEFRAWIERLETEHDNFRATLEWSLHHETSETGLRFTTAPRSSGGSAAICERRAWLERLLARGMNAPPQLRVKAMAPAGWLVRDLGDYERAIALQEESLEIFRAAGDELGMVECSSSAVFWLFTRMTWRVRCACFRQSLALCEELDNRRGRALARLLGTCRAVQYAVG